MRVESVESKQLQPRPPVASATPISTGSTRPTTLPRPSVLPHLLPGTQSGREPSDPYVRRFWTAVLGPGAVADLLRLIRAAELGKSLPRPPHLADLIYVGLAGRALHHLWVAQTVPDVPPTMLRKLPPALQRNHETWLVTERETGVNRP